MQRAIDELALLLAENRDENMTESGSPGAPILTIVRGDGTPLLDVETGLTGDVQQVRAADVNGDGRRDLLVLGYGGLVAHVQRVDGTFEPHTPYSLVGSAITAATLGDLDNDETQDLLIATTAGLKGGATPPRALAAEGRPRGGRARRSSPATSTTGQLRAVSGGSWGS